jgi:hypothetical protein
VTGLACAARGRSCQQPGRAGALEHAGAAQRAQALDQARGQGLALRLLAGGRAAEPAFAVVLAEGRAGGAARGRRAVAATAGEATGTGVAEAAAAGAGAPTETGVAGSGVAGPDAAEAAAG